MLLYHCHMPQCSMVAEQSNNLFPSYHLYSHCACSHCLWMFWYPVKAKQLHALQLSNNMWMQPCCLITGIILHKHSMVVELSAHLLPSHHHQNYCACAHGLWGFWDPVTTKLLPALQLTNHMWIRSWCLIFGIMLHNAAWWLNSKTTILLHTTSITTLHVVDMACGCTGTLLQQKICMHCH
jgi:hypothetical protein